MTLKDALGFVIDYGKFIATLWNGYVVFTVAVIGWLISIRKDGPLDPRVRTLLILAYLAATLIFGIVLAYNKLYLLNLHSMLHALAESMPSDPAVIAYKSTLGKRHLEPVLFGMLGALAVVAALAAWVMWLVASFGKKPPPPKSR